MSRQYQVVVSDEEGELKALLIVHEDVLGEEPTFLGSALLSVINDIRVAQGLEPFDVRL